MKSQPTTSALSVESAPVAVDSTYHLKWIQWNSGKIPIVMQSKNGPCPLIATMNVLLLREKIKLPSMLEQITADQLLTYLGECIMDCMPAEIQNDENAILNLEQNIHDAIEILPKLNTGLDVNIRFTGITDFEYTPECIVFDLLRIPLYHGWLSDPDSAELRSAIGTKSYNQLVDSIITNKTSNDPEMMAKVLVAEEFLERTASQLTEHGLIELKSQIKDNEIGILFRNNHFLTLFKQEGEIYTLVTDHGYLTEDNIIWEILDSIEGAGRFFDSNFHLSEITNKQVSEFKAIDRRQQQLENDFLMALSLREEEQSSAMGANEMPIGASASSKQEDDFELAKRLQEEENRIYEEMTRESRASSNNDRQLVPINDTAPAKATATTTTHQNETRLSAPRAQDTDPPSQDAASPASINQRWSQVVSKGVQPENTTVSEPPRQEIDDTDDFRKFSHEASHANQTTKTAPTSRTDEPTPEQTRPSDPNQAPSSSSSYSHTRPSVAQLQQTTTTRPQSSSSRRKGDRNSKEANCIVN